MWIICCCSIGLLAGMLLERTGSPDTEPASGGLGRLVLNSAPGLSIAAEPADSNPFTLEFGKPQSPGWCWFIATFLWGALAIMKGRRQIFIIWSTVCILGFFCYFIIILLFHKSAPSNVRAIDWHPTKASRAHPAKF